MLTGDKIETAVNIGYSCGLLEDSISQYVIDAAKSVEIHKQLEQATYQNNLALSKKMALIVGGESLLKILLSEKLTETFLKLSVKSVVVLACRVSPKQKAQVV